jgi:hypothetical protein
LNKGEIRRRDTPTRVRREEKAFHQRSHLVLPGREPGSAKANPVEKSAMNERKPRTERADLREIFCMNPPSGIGGQDSEDRFRNPSEVFAP